jgi:CreA protein
MAAIKFSNQEGYRGISTNSGRGSATEWASLPCVYSQSQDEGGMRKFGLILGAGVLLIVVLLGIWIYSQPERGTTGSVSTKFHLLGPNDKIVVDGFDDPKVEGVACHISRAQTGGVKGGFGVAEDTSDASIACRQIGPIKITGELKDGERVFDERRSLLFKTLQVVRFFDRERNVLVYVTYSDRIIEGSPKNSISSVPIMSWPRAQSSKLSQ